MRVLIFFGKPFEASPENEPSPSKSHYGKTKYGDKIAPCGRKKRLAHYPLSPNEFFTTAGSYFELYFVFGIFRFSVRE
jgi:hypothetical protein